MNKKVLLSLLLVPFLASCGRTYSVKSLDEIDAYVSKLQSHESITKVKSVSKGTYFGRKVDNKKTYPSRLTPFGTELEDFKRDKEGNLIYDSSNLTGNPELKIPTRKDREYGVSRHLYAPLFIDSNDFIYYDEFGMLDAACQFRKVKRVIVDLTGSNATFETEFLKDGGIRFYSYSTNMFLKLYNLDDTGEPSSAGARWDISLTYNKKGCLTEEYFATHDRNDKENFAEVKATYTHA